VLTVLTGCASNSVYEFADRHLMTVSEVNGDGFDHLVVQRMSGSSGNRLHVYIEGDGIPWSGNLPSANPTPRNTLALTLASLDPVDFIYVGRPCYFFRTTPPQCSPKNWTSHRYGEDVVRSMASAIERSRQARHSEVVLIGHSGGGTLAALLETRVEGVVGVVTVAANLDIDAWTTVHDYDALSGSLNPIKQTRKSNILHLQYVGGRDDSVPVSTSVGYSLNQPNVELIEFEEFDHVCCWEDAWPAILQQLPARIGGTEPD
jgi:predicted alpha/beta hydrolase family esterase